MDAKHFLAMISDKYLTDLKKMQYKYSVADVSEMVELMKSTLFKSLDIHDFQGSPFVYLDSVDGIQLDAVKLLSARKSNGLFGLKAMEDEIFSTLAIENIESSRASIRKILKGYAPLDDKEKRIYGMKMALEFIADPGNKITSENIHHLYQTAVGAFLEKDYQLMPDQSYRHDSVYVVGGNNLLDGDVEHAGLPYQQLPEYMERLIEFINRQDGMNELLKGAVIHFYLAYLHPYFDGNGRMARFLHLWYLIREGFPGTLFIPFSINIEKSKKAYYNAFMLIEKNAGISGLIDVTPFLHYFVHRIYDQLTIDSSSPDIMSSYQQALADGRITEKEAKLWRFVLTSYGNGEFSTKQLEKEFGDAAYATIRSFVMKFEGLELLRSQKYGSRVKYQVKT